MFAHNYLRSFELMLVISISALVLGCASSKTSPHELPWQASGEYDYLIGPGDQLEIFVWRNPELARSVPVRPDGKISVPLVEDLPAADKTATQLAREIEHALSVFVREPLVTVIVSDFQGVYQTQVRVVGQAGEPRSLPYRDNMTLLDVMIAVGGLTEFAAGNRSTLVRTVDGQTTQATVRLEDLIRDGDISANIPVAPGDVIIIPEAWF
jgi:polysaccharide export outer membrane protein